MITSYSRLLAVILPVALTLTNPATAAPGSARAVIVHDGVVDTGAIKVHYLRAGTGGTMVVLVHGWPESSREWRSVLPILAQRFTVVAPDLRGVGGSDAPATGYDKETLARDLHGLITALHPTRVIVVGHDIGGMTAYAYARLYPAEAAGVVILDVPLPGVGPWTQVKTDPRAWHFGFNVQDPLAEKLVRGRQEIFFRYFIDQMSVNPTAVTDADVAAFARAYEGPERLRAGFAFYRAFDADEVFATSHTGPLATPLLLAGGDHSMGPLEDPTAQGLRALGASDVRIAIIASSGHWIAEEQPEATAKLITDFADSLR